jgi:hypothetical protein
MMSRVSLTYYFQLYTVTDISTPFQFIPLATVEDRLVSVTEGFPNILPLFCDYEEQKLRNAYYGYIGMWKVSKADGTIPTARASYMVDEILGNDIIN